jgi:LPS-assembly lipoprotein
VKTRITSVALACAVLLTACGFRLQGRTPLPEALATVYVEAENPQTDFVVNLRRLLLSSGAKLARDASQASATVRVLEDEATRSVVSVSAANSPVEIAIEYKVSFAVVAGDRELLPAQPLAASRSFSFDERLLLAKEHEEDILREALARDLAGIAMRRLASL